MRSKLFAGKTVFYSLLFLITACSYNQSDDDSDVNNVSTDCNIDNGEHAATVDYYNPKTGYSKIYTLNVEVEDCQVTIIYFDNGGYLDESHIDAADIDQNGDANVEDDQGRTYDVHIDD